MPGSRTLGMVVNITKNPTQIASVLHATPTEQHAFDSLTAATTGSLGRSEDFGRQRVRFRIVPFEPSKVRPARAHSINGTVMSMMMIMTRQKWYRLRLPIAPFLQAVGTTPMALSSPTILGDAF